MCLLTTRVAERHGLKVCVGGREVGGEVVREWSRRCGEGRRKGDGGREMVTDHKAGWLHYRVRSSVVLHRAPQCSRSHRSSQERNENWTRCYFWNESPWADVPVIPVGCYKLCWLFDQLESKELDWSHWRRLMFNNLTLHTTLNLNHFEYPDWRSERWAASQGTKGSNVPHLVPTEHAQNDVKAIERFAACLSTSIEHA